MVCIDISQLMSKALVWVTWTIIILAIGILIGFFLPRLKSIIRMTMFYFNNKDMIEADESLKLTKEEGLKNFNDNINPKWKDDREKYERETHT